MDAVLYILSDVGEASVSKMYKYLYYSQAYSLVWDGELLFKDPIFLDPANTVIIKSVEEKIEELESKLGQEIFVLTSDMFDGIEYTITEVQSETIDAVLDYFDGMENDEMREVMLGEDPITEAKDGVVSTKKMQRFYAELQAEAEREE